MKKKIFHNLGLKLASLLLACIMWLLVAEIGDPKDRKVFVNIPVTLVNTELLDNQDKFYEIMDNTDRIRVTVRGPQSLVNDLKFSDIVAEADVSKLTDINTIAIECFLQNSDMESSIEISSSPEVVRLNVEDKARKWVRVQQRAVGEVAEGYMIAGTSLDQTMVEVTGPESAVNMIDSARAEIDVTGAATSMSANVEIMLYDSEGKLLELPNVTKNVNSIRMQVDVLATKTVPVEVNVMGTPADGYLATGRVTCDPDTITIAGTPSTLASVRRISIPEEQLDISGATGNVESTISIRQYLPDNVRLADSGFDGKVNVTVYIEPEVEKVLTIPEENIQVINMPEGFSVQEPEEQEEQEEGSGENNGEESEEPPIQPYELRVSGLNDVISPLDQNAIIGTVDIEAWMETQRMEELRPGTYRIPIVFEFPEEVYVENQLYMQLTIIRMEDL